MAENFDGPVNILDSTSTATIRLDAEVADVHLGNNGRAGNLRVRNVDGGETIRLNGNLGDAVLGGSGAAGNIYMNSESGDQTVHLSGSTANLYLGGGGQDGDVRLKDSAGSETITLDGGSGTATVGGGGASGEIVVKSASGISGITLDGESGELVVGSQGRNGYVRLLDSLMTEVIMISANSGNITCGANGKDGDIILRNQVGQDTIHLDGQSGDIILTNADCAEEFDVSEPDEVEPGSVMVLDDEGKVRRSTTAYDKAVAGVVSGAGAYKPGLILDRQSRPGRMPLALMGKVYCKVDARYGAIRIGDLLTSSPTRGAAMKASDPARAFGAVIGKALQALDDGEDMIPILVALQ